MAEITDKIEWETLEEEFTCGYCGDLFVELKTLSCSHTFCAKCIDDNFLLASPIHLQVADIQQGIYLFYV